MSAEYDKNKYDKGKRRGKTAFESSVNVFKYKTDAVSKFCKDNGKNYNQNGYIYQSKDNEDRGNFFFVKFMFFF